MALLLLHLHLVLLLLKLQMLMVLKNGCGTGRTGASSSCDGTTGDHGRGVVLFLLPGRSSGHGPHLCHELRVVPLEVLVAEDDRIVRSDPTIDLPEPPAVQLACKGRHLDSLEEPRQDLPCERVRVTDDEGPSIVHPCDAVLVGIALCFLRGVVHQRHHLLGECECSIRFLVGWDGTVGRLAASVGLLAILLRRRGCASCRCC
mmetsp:Transcript_57827/g.141250  ORF Transcript_57827/g.141250 Transcript_57827/m.141250 type:complete len:203 (+) Transcript_57827:1286-1894(+)